MSFINNTLFASAATEQIAIVEAANRQVVSALYETKAIGMKTSPFAKILLIDDDPLFGKIMQHYAAKMGSSLTFIDSVDKLTDEVLRDFDVAVIDYDLGSCTGVELVKYLNNRLGSMPIVLVSQTQRTESERWPDSIHEFVHKTLGPYAILDAAAEAHEIFRIHQGMRRSTNQTH